MGSGFPSVAFVTDVERAFSEGSRVLRPPTAAASHAMDAERAASSAVISLLGQIGWRRPGAKGFGSGGVAGRRMAVISEAVEALVSAYGLGAARVRLVGKGEWSGNGGGNSAGRWSGIRWLELAPYLQGTKHPNVFSCSGAGTVEFVVGLLPLVLLHRRS